MIAALFVVCDSDARLLKLSCPFSGGHVHDHPAAGDQMRPGGTRRAEDQIDLVAAGGAPLFVGDALDPAEVRPAREVEQHVDSAERAHRQLDKPRAVGRDADEARLERHHLAAGRLDQLDRLFCGLDRHVAADDQRTLAGERQRGRASHASSGPGDDADLARESSWHQCAAPAACSA